MTPWSSSHSVTYDSYPYVLYKQEQRGPETYHLEKSKNSFLSLNFST